MAISQILEKTVLRLLLFFVPAQTVLAVAGNVTCGYYDAPIQLLYNLKKDAFNYFYVTPDCRKLFELTKKKNKPTSDEEKKLNCESISRNLMKIWDCGATSISQVCFKKKLQEILNSNEGQNYIFALSSEVKAQRSNPSWNVWSFTLKYFNQDSEKAIRYLAVLFQSSQTNLTRHLKLDEAVYPYPKVINVLKNLESSFAKGQLPLLPFGVNGSSKKAYHFYPVAYAAFELKKKYPELDEAPIIAVLFNNRYEIVKSGKLRQGQFPQTVDGLGLDDLTDIYLGYQAYRYLILNQKSETLEDFKSKANKNYPQYIQNLL